MASIRLLHRKPDGEIVFREDSSGDVPKYAILSHIWGKEEVIFQDMEDNSDMSKTVSKAGWRKIQFCAEQAAADNLQYFWVDTCCIDKENAVELGAAINSMFRWYQNAARCYVYLSDVSKPYNGADSEKAWEKAFRKSLWFTRGWTLQELLAPSSVEFFSRERSRLGDIQSLMQQIHEVTRIPKAALQGAPLSEFSDTVRFSWIEHRQTKVEEDKAYSQLGIFGVEMPLRYGEGPASAFKRLEKEIEMLNKCLQDLHLTDPRGDKKRIEETKGGLLEDSYRWIFQNSDYQLWRDDKHGGLLWIKGDPGKGKTMLLCGIINELNTSIARTALLSYFFCQATDSRINSATAVLRGLLFLLINQKPSLVSHVRKKHDQTGKALFEDANAWVSLKEIFLDILQDLSLGSTYLVIDALDECVTGLPELLDFVIQTSSLSSRVKWILSSRNWSDIEERIERAGEKVKLSLELNAQSVSAAVNAFVWHKVLQLAERKMYSDETRNAVLDYLSSNAQDTFLWVALVCQNLVAVPKRNVIKKLSTFPPGLNLLYKQMIQQMIRSDDAELCKCILATIAVVYRPITLQELACLVEGLEDIANDLESLLEIISLCGSLLTIRDGTVYFVHQSAKDFLLQKAFNVLFPSGSEEIHFVVFSRSLLVMSKTLHRDMYSLDMPGFPIEQVQQPNPDPLVASRYSCIYWIDHFCDWSSGSSSHDMSFLRGVFRSGGTVDSFLRGKYVYWLEALSLCKSMSKGVKSMAKLETLCYVMNLSISDVCCAYYLHNSGKSD
jgi:hypothetical protein